MRLAASAPGPARQARRSRRAARGLELLRPGRRHRLPPPEARGLRASGRPGPVPPGLLPRLRPRRRHRLPRRRSATSRSATGALAALQGRDARVVPGVAEREHAVEIELPFLQAALGRFCLVPVLVGDTDDGLERAFAERLAKLDDGRTLFVFSSDFAHYGPRFDFQPFGALSPAARDKVRAMDERGVTLLASVDARGFRDYLRETGNTICGRHGLATMLELLPRIAPHARAVTLARYASADLPGHEGRQLGVVRRDGASCARRPPARASARRSSRCRGSRTRLPTRRLARADEGRQPRAPRPRRAHDPLPRARRPRPRARGVAERARAGAPAGRLRHAQPHRPRRGPREGAPARLHRPARADLPALLRHRAGRPRRGAARPALRAGERRRARRGSRSRSRSSRRASRSPRGATSGSARTASSCRRATRRRSSCRRWRRSRAGRSSRRSTALSEKAGLPSDGWKDGASFSVFTGQVFEEHP